MSKGKINLTTASKKDTLLIALHKAAGSISKACKMSSMSRSTLYRYMEEDADFKAKVEEVIKNPNPAKYRKHDVAKKVENDEGIAVNTVTIQIPSIEEYRERLKNGAEPHYAAEAKVLFANAIAELYENGVMTLADCCAQVGISHKTFWCWRTLGQNGYSEGVAMRWQQAENYLMTYKSEVIIQNCRESLEKLTKEREVTETHRTGRMVDVEEDYVNEAGDLKTRTVQKLVPWEVKNVVKNIQPSMAAIQLALGRLDKNFIDANKDKEKDDAKVDRYTLKGMSLEQLQAEKLRYKTLLEQTQ